MYPGEKQLVSAAEIADFVSRCVESFSKLCEYAAAKLANLGTLPDFGNFLKEIDKYEAVAKRMPFAKGVSFKCHDFDAQFKETTIDMDRMMKIVDAAGHRGRVGIEYEGTRMTELEGVQAVKRYLDKGTA